MGLHHGGKGKKEKWEWGRGESSGQEGGIYVIDTPPLLHCWADTSAFGMRGRKAERKKACIHPLWLALYSLVCATHFN